MAGGTSLVLDPAAMRATFSASNPTLQAANVPLSRTPTTVFAETTGTTVIRLEVDSLDWTAFGYWIAYPDKVTDRTSAQFVTGFQTPSGAVPTTGTAAFKGTTTGESSYWYLSGNANLQANFATGTLTGTLTDISAGSWEDGYLPWNSVSLTASFGMGQSAFNGTAAATSAPANQRALSGSATGTVAGSFFGPTAQELGAVWTLFDGTRSAMGAIAAGAMPP